MLFKLLLTTCKPNCSKQAIDAVLKRHRMKEKRARRRSKGKDHQPQSPGVNTVTMSGDGVEVFHSYATPVASAEETRQNLSEPSTPEAKKGKMSLTLEEIHKDIIQTINVCHDSLLSKIEKNARSIEDVGEKLKNLTIEMEEMKETVQSVKHNSTEQEKRIKTMEEKVNELESYQRRWNLRLYGVVEEHGENVKRKVTDICSTVAPETASTLHVLIDVCHRVGVREEGRIRPIIIRFVSRDAKENVWRAAKDSDFLKARRLRFSLDLTAKDKETRALLWPLVDAARKANKRAFFVGAKAIIDGKVVKQ